MTVMLQLLVQFSAGDLLYFENFDDYNVYDAISEVSQAFDLWPVAGATDAYVSDGRSVWHELIENEDTDWRAYGRGVYGGLEGFNGQIQCSCAHRLFRYYNVQENIVVMIGLSSAAVLTASSRSQGSCPRWFQWARTKHLQLWGLQKSTMSSTLMPT